MLYSNRRKHLQAIHRKKKKNAFAMNWDQKYRDFFLQKKIAREKKTFDVVWTNSFNLVYIS